jgi:hypothetical protein
MIKNVAIAVIIVGLASLVLGVLVKLRLLAMIAGISPSGFCQFTTCCFLLSISLLLLDKHS